MRRPSKRFAQRLTSTVATALMVAVGTWVFLHEVLHMEWGLRSARLVSMITTSWVMVWIWLPQKPKTDPPT